jgi:sporulation protein YlmC with PRC-barrel domain
MDDEVVEVSRLMGERVVARDGPLGCVVDAMFDEELLIVRYLVVRLEGSADPGTYVLLSRQALDAVEPGGIGADVTVDQVRSGPEVSPDEGVTREDQQALHAHHGWTPYWEEGGYELVPAFEADGGPHLRRVGELMGYDVRSRKGRAVGKVADLALDAQSWSIVSVLLDVPERSEPVRVAPHEILTMDSSDRRMKLELPDGCVGD